MSSQGSIEGTTTTNACYHRGLLEQQNARLVELADCIEAANRKYQELQVQSQALQATVESAEKVIRRYSVDNARQASRTDALVSALKRLQEREGELEREKQQLVQENEEQSRAIQRLVGALEEAKNQEKELRELNKDLNDTMTAEMKKIDEMIRENKEVIAKVTRGRGLAEPTRVDGGQQWI